MDEWDDGFPELRVGASADKLSVKVKLSMKIGPMIRDVPELRLKRPQNNYCSKMEMNKKSSSCWPFHSSAH
jgi:hypothetical protein